jgi:hypothetical protein
MRQGAFVSEAGISFGAPVSLSEQQPGNCSNALSSDPPPRRLRMIGPFASIDAIHLALMFCFVEFIELSLNCYVRSILLTYEIP